MKKFKIDFLDCDKCIYLVNGEIVRKSVKVSNGKIYTLFFGPYLDNITFNNLKQLTP